MENRNRGVVVGALHLLPSRLGGNLVIDARDTYGQRERVSDIECGGRY